MDHAPWLLELCWPALRSGARWPKLPRRYLDESYVAEGGSLRGKYAFFWCSYGHLLVLIGYFKGIKHSINWVISVLKTGKRAITVKGEYIINGMLMEYFYMILVPCIWTVLLVR